jgi:D-glycerate 3-kinase
VFCQLLQENASNRLLQVRGNAGTHDLKLGTDTLTALKSAKSRNDQVALPRYDKSKNQGRGDRADPGTWPRVQGPLDIILFEGWMLGFRPLPATDAEMVRTPTQPSVCGS